MTLKNVTHTSRTTYALKVYFTWNTQTLQDLPFDALSLCNHTVAKITD